MSSNQRIKPKGIKRQNNSRKNVGKRQKMIPDNGIFPVTATTRKVLFKKLNTSNQDIHDQQLLQTIPPASAKNVISARSRKLPDVNKYSPKNIKSPCKDRSASSSLEIINISQMCKYSPKNIKSPCSSNVSPGKREWQHESYVGNRNSILGMDIGKKHRKSLPDIDSTPSPSFSKNTIQKRVCNSMEEEDSMLLFFKSLLPYTVELSEEKKKEFKTKVVQWLKTIVSTTLEDLLD